MPNAVGRNQQAPTAFDDRARRCAVRIETKRNTNDRGGVTAQIQMRWSHRRVAPTRGLAVLLELEVRVKLSTRVRRFARSEHHDTPGQIAEAPFGRLRRVVSERPVQQIDRHHAGVVTNQLERPVFVASVEALLL